MKTESYPRKDYLTKLLPMIFLFLILGAGLNTRAYAQCTPVLSTIGTGTGITGSFGSETPFDTYWMDSRKQYLITASELNAAGLNLAPILTSIGFNVAAFNSYSMNEFTIRMAHTSLTNVTSTFVEGMTTYLGPSTQSVTATGWKTLTLDQPFFWDGTSNILIDVCFNNAGYSSSSTVYYTTVGFSACTYAYTDLSTQSGCSYFTGGTVSSNRPNMQFNGVPLTEPQAPLALSLSTPTYNSFVVNGTPYSTSNMVVVARENDANFTMPMGTPPAVGQPFAGGTLIYNGTAFPYTNNFLNPSGGNKNWFVRAWSYDGAAFSCFGKSASISTPCAVYAPATFTATLTNLLNATLNGTLNTNDNPVVIIRATSTGAFTAPSGTPPAAGQPLGGGTLIYYGTDVPVVDAGLAPNTTFYYRAYSYDAGTGYYSCDFKSAQVTTPCLPLTPVSITATAVSGSQIDVNVGLSANSDSIVVVYNTTGSFTVPSGTPPAAGAAFMNGTVLYKGKTFPASLSGLNPGDLRYFRAYAFKYNSTSGLFEYSCSSVSASATTLCLTSVPYVNSFETMPTSTGSGIAPCTYRYSNSTTYLLAYNTTPLTYNRVPRTGNAFLAFRYGASLNTYNWYMGPLSLTGGTTYTMKAWYTTSGTLPTGQASTLQMVYNTVNNSSVGRTVFNTLTTLNNTDYQEMVGQFCVPVTGTYYIGLSGNIGTSATNFYISVDDVSLEESTSPPAYTPPACVTTFAPSNGAPSQPRQGMVLSWTSVSGATSYDVYFGTSATPPFVQTINGTSYTVPGSLLANTTYYWQVVPKNCNAAATGCTVWNFSTGNTPLGYCASAGTSTGDDQISRVRLNTIDNTSLTQAGGGTCNGYTNFTAISTNLENGASYPITVTYTDCQFNYHWGHTVRVFIDFNQDYTFSNDEAVFTSYSPSQGSKTAPYYFDHTGTFTVPATAVGGPTRMRVMLYETSTTTYPACGNPSSYGETEDYTVVLSGQATNDLAITGIISPMVVNCGVTSAPVTITYKNNGTANQTTYTLSYFNGTSWVNEPVISAIAPGQTKSYTFVAPIATSTPGTNNITVKVTLTGDERAANDILNGSFTVPQTVVVTDPTVLPGPYFQNFDGAGPYFWAAGGNAASNWTLGTPAKTHISGPASAPNAWVTGLTGTYNHGALGWVESPCFDFSALLNPQFQFDMKYEIENHYDGAMVAYSIDGVNWIQVGDLFDPTNWYNDTSRVLHLPSWGGTSAATWTTAKHALDGLAGESGVRLRVYFASNNTIKKEGFAFDNVRVYESADLSAFCPNVNIEGTVGDTLDLRVKGGVPPYYTQWLAPAPYLSCNEALCGASCDPTACQKPIATPPATRTYNYKVWDSNIDGVDTVFGSVTVNVFPELQLDARWDATVCDTAITQLYAMASGGVPPYTYNWSPATGLNFTTIYNPISTTHVTTNYGVTVTDAIGFTKTDHVTLTVVHGFPVVDVHPATATICTGDSILLTATGGSIYSWSSYPAGQYIGTPNGPATWVKPTISGTKYTCVVSSTCGTASSFSVINIVPRTIPTLAPISPNAVCIDGNPITLSGGLPAGGTFSGNGVVNGVFYPAIAGAGPHTITYTYINGFGCPGTASRTITVYALPNVVLTFADDEFCIDDATVTLTAGQPAGGVYAGTGIVGNTFSPALAGIGEFVITYTYTSPQGCVNHDHDTLFVFPLPVVTAGPLAPVCVDAASFPLTVGSPAGGNYSGSGVSGNNFDPAVAGVGTHTITYCYADEHGCVNCNTTSITVNPLPTVSGTFNNTEICEGGSADYTFNFTGTAPFTLEWTIGGVAQADIVTSDNPYVLHLSPAASTYYTFTSVTDANGCDNDLTIDFDIQVNPNPLAYNVVLNDIVLPYGHYCDGTGGLQVGLDGSENGVTYYLYRDNVYTGESFVGNGLPFWFLAHQTVDGYYTVKAVDMTFATNCERWMTGGQWIIKDVLNVDLYSQFQEICVGGTSTIQGVITNPNVSTGPYTFNWTPTGVVTALEYDSIMAYPTSSTWIHLTVVDPLGCIGQDSFYLVVNNPPTVQILGGANSFAICDGQGAVLTTSVVQGSGSSVASYTWAPAGSLDLTNPAAPVATPNTNTTYYLTVTDDNGCTAYDQITVTVNPSPNVYFIGPNTANICPGGSIALPLASQPGSYTYAWSPAGSLNNASALSPIASPSVTTTYTVTVTSNTAPYCFRTGTFTVIVDDTLEINAGNTFSICNGTQANLAVQITEGGTAPFNYNWAAAPAATWITPTNTQNPTAIPASNVTTVFTVTVTDAHGCVAVDNVTVTSSNVPVAYAGPNDTICEGQSSTLTGSGGPTYQWFVLGNPAPLTPAWNNPSLTVTPSVTTTYELRTNSICGPAVSNVTVVVNPATALNIGIAKTTFCADEPAITVTGVPTDANGVWTGTGITDNGDGTASFSPTTVGTYALTYTYTNMYGCEYSTSVTVTVNPLPVVSLAPISAVCIDATSFALTGGSPAGGLYSGTGVSGGIFNPAVAGIGSHTITYSYTNVNGCVNTASQTLVVNPLPAVYNVSVDNNGHYCAYTPAPGVHIYLDGSEGFLTGVVYRLYLNNVFSGISYPGTGFPIDFGPQTATGHYEVWAFYPSGCSIKMNGSADVAIDPLPLVYNVSGGGTYCFGGSGVTVSLNNSNFGVTYELYRNGSYVTSLPGVNGVLNFNNVTGVGNYTVKAVNNATGCYIWMSGSANVATYPLPLQYSVSIDPGLTTLTTCTGTPVTIRLVFRECGVNYELYHNGVPTGQIRDCADGVSLTWTSTTFPAGVYTIVGTRIATGCKQVMRGSVTLNYYTPLAVSNNPVNQFIDEGGSAVFSGAASGDMPVYQWEVSTDNGQTWNNVADGGVYSGAQTNMLYVSNAPYSMTRYMYRLHATGPCNDVYTNPATLYIDPIVNVFFGAPTANNHIEQCAVNPVYAPIYFAQADSILAISLTIYYDNTNFQYVGYDNLDPLLNAFNLVVFSNPNSNKIGISYYGNPLDPGAVINTGHGIFKMLDLKFNAVNAGGTCHYLNWDVFTQGACELSKLNGEVLTSNFYNGEICISPLPTITAAGALDAEICENENISLYVSAYHPEGVTYSWTGPNGFTSNEQNPVIYNALPLNGGTYHVVVSSIENGCISETDVEVIVHPKPTVVNVILPNGNSACAGSGVEVALDGSDAGTTYQLYHNGQPVPAPDGIANGTGGPITFGPMWMTGNYTVLATSMYGCQRWMAGNPHIQINPLPLWFYVQGGGHYCEGGMGKEIKLNGSQIGVQYTLLLNACCCQADSIVMTLTGTGSPISFGYMTTPGYYSVVAVNPNTGCQNNMVGCVPIIIDPLPTAVLGGAPSICYGTCGNITLNMTGKAPFTVTLSNGTTTFSVVAPSSPWNVSVCPTTTTTYTIVGITDANTCSNTGTGSATVTVFELPQVTVSNTSPVCVGGSVTLNSTVNGFGPFSFSWTGPNGFTSTDEDPMLPLVGLNNAGEYVLTVTDGHNCVRTVSTTVVVNPLPVVDATGSEACVGGMLYLNVYASGNGPFSYSWTGPNGFSSTEMNPMISPAAASHAGIYNVVVTDANGCVSTDVAELIVYALPLANCGSNSPVCEGGILNLTDGATGFGPFSYHWTGPNGFMSTEENPSISGVSLAAAGDYILHVYDGHQCMNSCTTAVVINPLPTPCQVYVTEPNVYCFGCIPPVVWLACSEAGVEYTLYHNGVATTNMIMGDGDSISFGYVDEPGTYTVYAVNVATGCANWMTGDVQVFEQAPPTASITGDEICVGETPSLRIDLTGDSYWYVVITDGVNTDTMYTNTTPYFYTPGTGPNILAPTATTTYTISIVFDRVCYNTGNSAVLTINPLPAKYTLVGGGYYCSGLGVNVGLNGSQAGIVYTLRRFGVDVATVTGTGSAITFGPQPDGVYTAYAVNPVTGCANDMNGQVIVLPDPNLNGYEVYGGGEYCFGQPGVTIYTNGSQLGIQYHLILNGIYTGTTLTGTGSGLAFTNVTLAGTYTVLAFDPVSTCTRNMTGSASVVVNPLPTATISGNATICYGQSATLNVVLTGTAPWHIVVSDGFNSKYHTVLTASWDTIVSPMATTTYVITTVIDDNCQNSGSGSATVTVNSPTPYVITGGGAYCAGGQGVIVGLSGSQLNVDYELYYNGFPTGTVIAGTGNPISFGYQTLPGTYTVVATNLIDGCVRNMNGVAVVSVTPLPTVYNVTGGGNCCLGCTHVFVCLDGSQVGVVYELFINGMPTGILKYGNGQSFCYPFATVGGYYTIKATNIQTGCWTWMNGGATVVIYPTAQGSISGGGTICAGECSTVTVSFSAGTAPFSFGLSANGGAPIVFNNIMTNTYTFDVCPTNNTSYTLAWVSDAYGCFNAQTSGAAVVNVTQLPGVFVPTFAPVCVDAAAFELTGGSPAGGVYSGVGVDNGWFYPAVAGAGSHVITYTYTNPIGCQGYASTTIVVNPLPFVEFTGLETSYCIDAAADMLVGTPAGGTFAGAGIINNGPGIAYFNPALAGLGQHTVYYYYTDQNGCYASYSATTEVLALPVVSFAGLNAVYCLNAAPVTLTGTPAGGVFSGPGMVGDVFNPMLAGVGTHTITYTFSNSFFCQASFSAQVTVLPLPETCTFTGGGFCCVGCSVPAILSCSQPGYIYQLVRNGNQNVGLPVIGNGNPLLWEIFIGGTYTVVATAPSTGCSAVQSGSVTVVITPQPEAITTGSTSVCVGQCATVSVALSGVPPFTILFTNGTDTVAVNGIMGFSWDTLVCPTATTTYAVASIQDAYCGNNGSGSATVVVNPPAPVFNVTGGGATCAGGAGVAIGLDGSVVGLHYELFLNGNTTGVVVIGTGNALNFGDYAVAGIYTVHSLSAQTCEMMMNGYAEVVVNTLPAVSLQPFAAVCASAAPFTLSGGMPAGGYYTVNGTPFVEFDPSMVGAGTAMIGYVYEDGNGCVNTAYQSITVYALPAVSIAPIAGVCFSAPAFPLSGGSPAGGVYTINGDVVTSFNPATLGVGNWTVVYTYTDGNGCANSASTVASVYAMPNVGLSTFAPVCLGADPVVLSGGFPAGGVYSGQNVVNGVFTPTAIGTYTITYYYTSPFGCSGFATSTIEVISCAVYGINGTVTYNNNAQTVMSNINVYLMQGNTTLATTTTDANGAYSFSGLIPGNYSVSASSTKPWGGVNSNDALLIMKHFAGISLLSGLRAEAADVNGDNVVNSTDALITAKRFVNQIQSFPAGDWVFQVNNVTITNSNVVNNFQALCYGDVNGSYTPPYVKTPASVNLGIAGVKEIQSYESFELPISVVGNLKVGAISLVLSYPSELYSVEGVTLNAGQNSNLLYTTIDGELRISWYSMKEMNLSDNDVLLTLQLRAKDLSAASESELALVLDGISEIGDRNAGVVQTNLTYPKLAIAANEFSVSNYPNPFKDVTEIIYNLPEAGTVSLTVYNLLGEEVAVLVDNAAQTASTHKVVFDASGLVQGVYTFKLEVSAKSGDFVQSGRMILSR